MRRFAGRHAVVVVLALAALAGGCTADEGGARKSTPAAPTPTPRVASEPVTLTSGDVALTYQPGTFAAGVRPTLRPVTPSPSAFLDALGLSTASGTPSAVEISAPTQPAVPVEVVFSLDPATVPDGAVPAVFYLEQESGLWLPVPSIYEAGGRLVGRADHFTDFTAALLRDLKTAEQGADWFAYQVANVTGARADPPVCDPGAQDGITVVQDPSINAPVLGCAQRERDGALVVKVVNNRAFSLALTPSVPPASAVVAASANTATALYKVLADSPLGAAIGVWAPAVATIELTWEPGTVGPGPLRIGASSSPGFAVLDSAVAAVAYAVGVSDVPELVLVGFADCLDQVVETAGAGWRDGPSELVNGVSGCLDSMLIAMRATVSKKGEQLLKGFQAALLMGRGGQSVLDAGRDLGTSPGVVVLVAGDLPDPGAEAVPLHEVARRHTGVGPSGDATDATLVGGVRGEDSTTQWAGCDGKSATGVYDLGGRFTRLKALLGPREFAPSDLVIAVSASVDGRSVGRWTLRGDPVLVDVPLPAGGSQLVLSARVVGGSCSFADVGYVLWGNGALYR